MRSKDYPLTVRRANYDSCLNARGQRRVRKDGTSEWQIPNRSCRSPRVQNKGARSHARVAVTEKIGNPHFWYRCSKLAGMTRTPKGFGIVPTASAEIASTQDEMQRLEYSFRKHRIVEERYEEEWQSLTTQLGHQRKTLAGCVGRVPKISKVQLADKLGPFAHWDTIESRGERRRMLRTICAAFRVRVATTDPKGILVQFGPVWGICPTVTSRTPFRINGFRAYH